MKARVTLCALLLALASCGVPPRGDVTLTRKSGSSEDVRLLAVETDKVLVRTSDAASVQSIPFDSIAELKRAGGASPLAVIGGGLLGVTLGGFASASMYHAWQVDHRPQPDPRTIDYSPVSPPPYFEALSLSAILGGAALGILAGTFIRRASTEVTTTDPQFVERARKLALFPNGLPRHIRDSLEHR